MILLVLCVGQSSWGYVMFRLKHEIAIYLMIGVCCLVWFRRRFRQADENSRNTCMVLTAAVYTLIVFLLNNIWHWMQLMTLMIPLHYLMAADLTYDIGYGALRYPAVFCIALAGLFAESRIRFPVISLDLFPDNDSEGS